MKILTPIAAFVAAFNFLVVDPIQAELPVFEVETERVPGSEVGEIRRLRVESECLGGSVVVDVWTPAGYVSGDGRRYPVVYAHDGQNLFDGAFSFAGVPWAIDRACSSLADDPDFVMPIIVGINNRGEEGLRPNDYFPEKALNYISPDKLEETFIFDTCRDVFLGDEEAAFVVEELKPLIDSLYDTLPGVTTTFAMGSSMGSLASIYLLCEYPQVFGGAACLSTHWIGSLNLNPDYSMNDDEVCAQAILQYLSDNLPSAGLHRLYMDQGTAGWDAGYMKYETIAREIVRDKGYTEENGLLFTYDAKGAGHNEWFWQQRIDIPLKFLLSKTAIESAEVEEIGLEAPDSLRADYIYDLMGNRFSVASFPNLDAGIYLYNGKKILKTE